MSLDELIARAKANPGHAVGVLWAINFFLNVTDLVTFRRQGLLSAVLAVTTIGLLLWSDRRDERSTK